MNQRRGSFDAGFAPVYPNGAIGASTLHTHNEVAITTSDR